jgi:hypothetical protein
LGTQDQIDPLARTEKTLVYRLLAARSVTFDDLQELSFTTGTRNVVSGQVKIAVFHGFAVSSTTIMLADGTHGDFGKLAG